MPQAAESLLTVTEATDLIRRHYRMQKGRMISSLEICPYGATIYSDVSAVPMWNHSAWFSGPEDEFLAFIHAARLRSEERSRRPAVYLISHSNPNNTDRLLEVAGYEAFDQEAWLLLDGAPPAKTESDDALHVAPASTQQEIQEFIDVFYAAFQISDAGFADLLRRQMSDSETGRGIQHFIGYSQQKPVCVGTFIEHDGNCCIYNVGTSPGARNRGYAARLMEHLLRATRERNQTVFLQTSKDSAAERLYLRLGFKPAFVRTGFRLMNWNATRPEARSGWFGRKMRLVPPSGLPSAEVSSSSVNGDVRYRKETFRFPNRTATEIRDLASRFRIHAETMLIGSWAQLLARYGREESVAFGLRPDSPHTEAGADVFLPFTVTVTRHDTIETWLRSIEKQRIAVQPRNDNGSPSVPGKLGQISDPPFDFVVDFRKPCRKSRMAHGAPLSLLFHEDDPGCFKLSYDPGVFTQEAVHRMGRQLITWLENAVVEPQALVISIEILSAQERQELQSLAAGPPVSSETYQNLIHLFEAQVEKQPEATALICRSSGAAAQGENSPNRSSRVAPMNVPLSRPSAFATAMADKAGTLSPSEGERAGVRGSVHGEDRWTYWQLNRKANQLAQVLRKLGVGPDVYTGICLNRPLDCIIVLLAVLKAGGTAVPLDPEQPPERLAFFVNDSRLPLLFTSQKLASQLPKLQTKLVCTESAWQSAACEAATNLAHSGTADHTAYIIYTSGSTGSPKGVLVSNFALAQHCLDIREHYNLTAEDRVLQFASFHFDAAFEQILPPLLSGATLVLRGSEVWKPAEFAEQLGKLGLTIIDLPTAYWHQLVKEWAEHPEPVQAHQLRLVLVGGEAMMPETVRLWQKTPLRHVRLLNAYGPTEATITASTFELNSWPSTENGSFSRVPIGRPRAGRFLYVVDHFGQLAPTGVPGELCIGGKLIARGYLNRPELTREKFVHDPFQTKSEARIYRTGDLVRYLPDGNLEFLGRIDDQVKIRGFRIELGEIETVLNQHSCVQSAVVVSREDTPGDKQIVAYVVPRETRPSERDLRFFLKQKLPDYMVPATFVSLDALPLTSTGKVDRRALPKPEPANTDRPALVKGPSDPLELRLQLLFEKILRRRPIGVDISFFELGGDSLQALELIVAIERTTGRNLPLETLYQSSTIEGLANILHDPATGSESSSLVPLQPHGTRPPLFLIHTTPGDVLGYGNLIYHLHSDQPCYGIQSRGLIKSELAHRRIEEMAAFYIEQIQTIQPSGPYYLSGWCYGGIVAVEMAHQLFANDEAVALLALFETLAPAPSIRVTEYYSHRLGCFFRMHPAEWLTYFRAKLKYHRDFKVGTETRFHRLGWGSDVSNNPTDGGKLAQLQHVYELNLKALARYQSTPYPGRVTLFNAAEMDSAMVCDRHYGWVGLADEIEIHTVPGSHDTMLAEPHVSMLAQKLETCLRRTQNRARRKAVPLS